MSRVFTAVLAVSMMVLLGCGRDRNDQAENPYDENEATAERYGSAERYGTDPNAETRMGSAAQAGMFIVPEDTFIEVSLNTNLNSQTAKEGDEFTAEVIEPIQVNGEEAIPAGATIHGVVKEVYDPQKGTQGASQQQGQRTPEGQQPQRADTKAGSMDANKARLTLAFTRIELADGYSTNVVASLPTPSEVQMARNRGLGGGSAAGGEVLGRRGEEQTEEQRKKAEEKEKDLPVDIQSGMVGTGIIVAKDGTHVNLPAGTELTVQLDEELRVPRKDEQKQDTMDPMEEETPRR
ncbi:MAG TPA: hypothetical protein VJV23_07160 [Candidatus Polarisedimenticolia bacterium]|nr:hypothetical protein [Candidatus Polarisedimenticolia bacterium]